jgi:hypothetical protein
MIDPNTVLQAGYEERNGQRAGEKMKQRKGRGGDGDGGSCKASSRWRCQWKPCDEHA